MSTSKPASARCSPQTAIFFLGFVPSPQKSVDPDFEEKHHFCPGNLIEPYVFPNGFSSRFLDFPRLMTPWPLRRKGARWKRSDFIGKPSINGPFSMAMLNNQRVMYVNVMLVCWILIWDSWKIVRFQISIHSQFLWPFRWWFPNANRHGGCAWLYYNKPRKGAEIGKFSFSNQTLLIGKSHDNHLIIYRSRSITMTSLQHH